MLCETRQLCGRLLTNIRQIILEEDEGCTAVVGGGDGIGDEVVSERLGRRRRQETLGPVSHGALKVSTSSDNRSQQQQRSIRHSYRQLAHGWKNNMQIITNCSARHANFIMPRLQVFKTTSTLRNCDSRPASRATTQRACTAHPQALD